MFDALFFLGLVKCRSQRQKSRHYGPVDLSQSPNIVVKQLDSRKNALERHIGRLEKQLSYRKSQLSNHDRLQQVVTARMDEAPSAPNPKQQAEWEKMMARGRSIYGDAWDQPTDGNPPLCLLMTMHKDELLQIKYEAKEKLTQDKTRLTSRLPAEDQKRFAIERHNSALLHQHQQTITDVNNSLFQPNSSSIGTSWDTSSKAPLLKKPRSPTGQWTSYRRRGAPSRQTQDNDEIAVQWTSPASPAVAQTSTLSAAAPIVTIPALDFSKLSAVESMNPSETYSMASEQATQAKIEKAAHRRARVEALQKLKHSST